jgi:hypothetical protein
MDLRFVSASTKDPAEIEKARKRERALIDEGLEICKWLRPILPEEREEFTDQHIQGLLDFGLEWRFVKHELKRGVRKGAPGRARKSAVLALERLLLSPKTTWLDLAKEFCGCEKRFHDNQCAERVRQKVTRLRNFLKKKNLL